MIWSVPVHISRVQMMGLMYWMVMATGLLAMPLAIAHFTVRDGWISALVFLGSSLLVSAVCFVYARLFPGMRLSEAIVSMFGPIVGHVLGLWLTIWIWIFTALILYQFLSFSAVTIMPMTPLPVLDLAFLLPVTYAVFLGIEAIARFGEFVLPIAVPVFLILSALMVERMHLVSLLPVLADGWTPIFQASVQPAISFGFELVLVLEIFPELRSPQTVARDIFLVGVILTFTLVLMEILIVATIGGAATYLQYPVLEVIRGVELGRFIQRLDTIYVIGVVTVMMIKVMTLQYMFMSSIRSVSKLPASPMLIMSASALTGASGIYFWRNNFDFAHFSLYVSPAYFTVTLLFLPLMTIMVKLVRQRLQG